MTAVPLLLWLATCGADASYVFSEPAESRVDSVFGERLLSAASPLVSNPLETIRRPSRQALMKSRRTVRAQSADSLPGDVFVIESAEPPGWKPDLVQEFIEGMNPFSQVELRTLEGYYDPYGWQASYGINGHQAWRLGWVTYNEFAMLPFAPVTSGTTGAMQMVEWNSNLRVSELIAPGVLFNGTGYFNAHWWDGPSGIALPGQVDQISTDLELGFFNGGPWSGQIAFHPQIVDGYESRLNRYAFNFDGRAIATYKASPSWSFVGGVAFWDRVHVLVVPHVGVIWAPDDRWELRLLYPKSRISYYLGRWSMTDIWAYGAFEYTAESYQANIGDPTQVADRIQITDDRLSLGVRWDTGRYSFFVEGGFVFNRQAKFAGPTPNFDLGDVGMIRAGARY